MKKQRLLQLLLIQTMLLLFFTHAQSQVFITELADPDNDAGLRYVELYNAGDVAVDFTEGSGWHLDKYTNESETVSQTLNLTGTIPAKGFYIIATGEVDADFETAYGIAPDQFDGDVNNVAGSNGDDNLELYNGSNVLVDQFGVPGEDGTGTSHEFEDGRAERVNTVTVGKPLWNAAEWNIDSDIPTGDGPQNAPDDFDPGIWIGKPDTEAPIATWTPSDTETDVYINSNIVLSFDEPVRNINDTEITDANVALLLTLKLTDIAGADVPFTATISTDKQTITINPSSDLLNNQVYYAGLAAVEDANDNALVAQSINFTTIDASVAYIQITDPVGEEVYYAGDNPTVIWNSANIATVDIKVYIPDSDEWIILADDITSDGSETVSIPTDADYGTEYKIAVIDISNTANADTSNAFTIIATPTINTIQSSTSDGDATVFINDKVQVSGIVSYINGSTYYLQDGAGAWNGIMVYDGSHASSLTVGDSITILCSVTEYYNVTELTTVTSLTNHESGKAISIEEITTVSYDESYESVLVKFIDTKVTNSDLGNGEFEVNDGSGPLVIDDKYYKHTSTINENITVTGIGYYSYGAYKVLPRNYMDIISSSDTVTSSEYTVDNAAETITNIPYSTTLATFKSNVSACDSATYEVYDADGTTPATVLDDTKLLSVVAADGITTKTYTITKNAVSSVASVTSSIYTVNDLDGTITSVPFGTDLATFESNIIAPDYGSFETYESNSSTVATDLQSDYVVTGTAEDGTTTKSYTITINAAPMDDDSYVQAPTTQIAEDIAVVAESDGRDESFPVFSFDIADAGTADGEPTRVSQMVIYFGPEHTADIEMEIDSGYFAIDGTPVEFSGEPVVGSDSVAFTFADGQIVVPDGGSVNAIFYVNLDSNATADSVLQFMIPADDHGFEAYPTGSGFTSPFSGDIVGNKITIDVVATELQFVQQPTSVFVNDTVEPAVVIQAVDENGNIDQDFATDISLTSTGANLLYSPHVATPLAGVAMFDTLIFSSTGDYVFLSAVATPLPMAVSDQFIVAEESNLDLYFSEYIEGSSYNKALEIYNPTGLEVDLTKYIIKGTSDSATDWEYEYTFPDTAVINPNDVFVIVHSSAMTEMIETGDWVTGGYIMGYNGNDARGLFKINDGDTVLIDLLGSPYHPDESNYAVAGIESGMKEHTIVRKPTINEGNTDWTASAGTNAEDSEWLVYDQNYSEDLGKRSLGGNSETEILTFNIPGITVDTATKIIADNDSIAITVVYSAQLDSLFPKFTLSTGATSVPVSGDSVDFSTGQADIIVTAEDNTTKQTWTVYVVEQLGEALSGNDILSFEVSNQVGNSEVNTTKKIISANVRYGSDLSKLVPVFKISDGAKSTLISGDTTNFTDTVEVTITAEDGSLAIWKISVSEEIPVELTIYNIQFTEEASGISPYVGKLVNIKGYVTALDEAGFFIQDADSAWSGIYVHGGGSPEINDSVTVIGVVSEYYDLTEIKDVVEFVSVPKDNAAYDPIDITTLEASDEKYESVLVRVIESECTNDDADFGMFELNDGTGAILVDDVIYAYSPTQGNYYSVTGIAYFSYSERKILPRSADDIIDHGTMEASDDAYLSDLLIDGTTVTGFNPAIMSYEPELPAGTTATPVVTYTTSDENATAVVENATDVTSGNPADRTTKVIVTAENKTTTKTYSILFRVESTNLVEVELSDVTIYPNPAHSELVVHHTSIFESIKILNVTGKQITSLYVDGRESVAIDISDLQNGLYIIQLKSGDAISNLKFIKE